MFDNNKYLDKIIEAPLSCFSELINKKDYVALLYKFDTPLDPNEATFKSNKKFSLFELAGFTSLNVIFAYCFIFPFKSFELKEKYIIIRRPSSKNIINYSNVELIYQSPYINIYNSEDGGCMISANGLYKVILPEIVRKSKKPK